MKNNNLSKKAQQFGGALLVIALIISVFAIGLYTGDNDKVTGAAVGLGEISGNLVKITGLDTLKVDNYEVLEELAGGQFEIIKTVDERFGIRDKSSGKFFMRLGDGSYQNYLSNGNEIASPFPGSLIYSGDKLDKVDAYATATAAPSLPSPALPAPPPTVQPAPAPAAGVGEEAGSTGETTYIYKNILTGSEEEYSLAPDDEVSYKRITTGVSGKKDEIAYFKPGASEPYLTQIRDSSTGSWYTLSSGSGRTTIYQGYYNGKWYEIPGTYSSISKAKEACGNLCSNIKIQSGPSASSQTYNVFNTNGKYLGSIPVEPSLNPDERGDFFAKFVGSEFGYVELPSFKVSHPSVGEEIYREIGDKDAAIRQFEQKWGISPNTVDEIRPDTFTPTNVHYLINKETGERITTINLPEGSDPDAILNNYRNNPIYSGIDLELKKAPTLKELQEKYPLVPSHILQRELENYAKTSVGAEGELLKEPKFYEIEIEGKKVWYVNDQRYEDFNKANSAFTKAKEGFNKALSEKFAKDQLDGKKLTGEITQDGELLATDSEGVYKFVPQLDTSGRLIGGEFKPVGALYTTKETIGKEDNTFDVIRIYETKDRTQVGARVIKDGISIPVDEETIKQIENNQEKNLDFKIVQQGLIVGIDTILEFRDKDNELVQKITLNGGYSLNDGTKTTDNFRTIYIKGKESISADEYGRLSEEQQKEYTPEDEILVNSFTTKKSNGEVVETTTTNYRYSVIGDDKRMVGDTITITNKGERSYAYSECNLQQQCVTVSFKDGVPNKCEPAVLCKNFAWKEGEDKGALGKRANTKQNQDASRQFFAQLESVLTDFSGLGYYATLFFDDKDLDEWRENVDQTFADLYLGIEYWESAICAAEIDRDQQGVAYIDTKLGLAAVAAHIEATRQQRAIILPPDAQQAGFSNIDFLYKITFNVRNGDFDDDPKALEEMRFNIFLRGERTAKLFRNDIILEKGDEFGKTGQQAIVQFSDFFYDEICISFDDVPSFWTLDSNSLCNKIIGAVGIAEPLATAGQPAQQTGGGEILDI